MDGKGKLLKKLCSRITGITDERVLEHYELAVALLNDDVRSEAADNLKLIIDQIKRWLVQENRMQDAIKVSLALTKIEQSNILVNKAAILNLLLCLRKWSSKSISRSESDTSVQSFPSCLSFGLVNGFGCESLHSPSSKCSNDSQNSSRMGPMSQDSERCQFSFKEKKEGRVARLAAFYKARTKVPDEIIIGEVLFAFQGIGGKILRYNTSDDGFKIDPQVLLSQGEKDSIMKLTELGWLYTRVKRFCEMHGSNPGSNSVLPPSLSNSDLSTPAGRGLVNQSLIMALKEELNEYCRLIAVLETQTSSNAESSSSLGLTLRRLMLWTLEPKARLHTLCLLTHAAQDTSGGATLSEVYKYLLHGDSSRVAVVKNVLSQACRPLFVMLTEWLLDGSLQDPHHEFFIASNPTVPNDQLWHAKYDVRWCMLPSFIRKDQAEKVLATGKSHNFLRNVCHFKSQIADKEAIKSLLKETTVESLFTQDEDKLDDLISLTFRTTSSHVLNEILTQHKLLDHLRALRRYLLLGQGDFINNLLDILEPELCKPASKLHPHNLSSLLETAVNASNAQFEEEDILKRLDLRLLDHSPGETGWDVFSLDYHVHGPIGTVFTSECMDQYLTLFNALWRAKHMEWILSSTWKQQAAVSKLCRALPELGGVLHRMQLLLNEMIHLIQQMAYYITFEVLECSWHVLMSDLKSAQSLDDIINAHSHFLKRIMAGALLDEQSNDVRAHLRSLYDPMLRLQKLQEKLSNAVFNELAARRKALELIEERTRGGAFGLSAENEEAAEKRMTEFKHNFVTAISTDLNLLTNSYKVMVQNFLLRLTQDEDENLHLLSSRIDFNRYYYQRDQRLTLRLTYSHKRKTIMGASFCQ